MLWFKRYIKRDAHLNVNTHMKLDNKLKCSCFVPSMEIQHTHSLSTSALTKVFSCRATKSLCSGMFCYPHCEYLNVKCNHNGGCLVVKAGVFCTTVSDSRAVLSQTGRTLF